MAQVGRNEAAAVRGRIKRAQNFGSQLKRSTRSADLRAAATLSAARSRLLPLPNHHVHHPSNMTAGQDQSPSRASDSTHSDRGRDPARRTGGRGDEDRASARYSSHQEPAMGSASSTTPWYFDHDLGIIHRGGRCPTCRAMNDHQMRHRCDDSYQEAVAAREEKQAAVIDAAVRRATAHLEASNEALRRSLFRVEDEREQEGVVGLVVQGGDGVGSDAAQRRSPRRHCLQQVCGPGLGRAGAVAMLGE